MEHPRSLLLAVLLHLCSALAAQTTGLVPDPSNANVPRKRALPRWHITWSFVSMPMMDTDNSHLMHGALPDDHLLVPSSVVHFDLLHRHAGHWQLGLGYIAFIQQSSGFIERSREHLSSGGWFGGSVVVCGDGFGLEQHVWMAGPLVAFDPSGDRRRRSIHANVKFIGGLRLVHMNEKQVIAPDYAYSYESGFTLWPSDVELDAPPFPADRPTTAEHRHFTALVDLSARCEMHYFRYFSVTLDVGAYIGPNAMLPGCTSINSHGDQLTIATHVASYTSPLANVGLALHF